MSDTIYYNHGQLAANLDTLQHLHRKTVEMGENLNTAITSIAPFFEGKSGSTVQQVQQQCNQGINDCCDQIAAKHSQAVQTHADAIQLDNSCAASINVG
jgi:uncharacterized protein YukE